MTGRGRKAETDKTGRPTARYAAHHGKGGGGKKVTQDQQGKAIASLPAYGEAGRERHLQGEYLTVVPRNSIRGGVQEETHSVTAKMSQRQAP